jgi:hypothetical protein
MTHHLEKALNRLKYLSYPVVVHGFSLPLNIPLTRLFNPQNRNGFGWVLGRLAAWTFGEDERFLCH